ncbi:glucose-6-phosphate dehydrogenase [Aurantivibrio infirmus]
MKCDILIIGGEGDLAYRKLYPALYHLDLADTLHNECQIVGIARTELNRELFCDKVKRRLSPSVGAELLKEETWQRFSDRLHYFSVDATCADQYEALKRNLFNDDAKDLIVYLATPPSIFAPICEALKAVGLVRSNTRIVVEKPLGDNRQSFLEINNSLTSIFNEEQVYRIDHYLGKETVQNLLAMRFANALFEPLWNTNYIDHVQITVAETVGVEGRWEFYDEAGALRDMVQNHLLQLLCLVAMEPPAKLDPTAVHEEKLKVLKSLKPMVDSEVNENSVRGLYTSGAVNGEPVVGYCDEEGAKAETNTETFVALKAEINNWRWAGVPFYLRTGKRMPKRFSEIVIQFNEVPHSIFGEKMTGGMPNQLVIRLQPEEGIRLHLLNKVPGLDDTMPLRPVVLDVALSEAFVNRRVPDAYERLLYDVIRSNSTLFMRADQVEAAWEWVDGIIDGWQKNSTKVVPYTAGSWGPSASIALVAKDGRNWNE